MEPAGISSRAGALAPEGALCHRALFYDGAPDFLKQAVPYVQAGLAVGEPVLVMVDQAKGNMLRRRLGDGAERVSFADMHDVGRNPARIIPAWQDFIDQHPRSARLRGIGEPIWAERSRDELEECHLHEALLNVAFAHDGPSTELLCPYDVGALTPGDVAHARCTHPVIIEDGHDRPSDDYDSQAALGFVTELPTPPSVAARLLFEGSSGVARVRSFVRDFARQAGLAPMQADDLELAASELATNSVRHGGGGGETLLWLEADACLCEFRDGGHIVDALAGRIRPRRGQVGTWGLWMANQLCDLVQIRSTADGNSVRLKVALR